jgi:Fe-S cluster assembly iron-binding protein IscA
MLSIAPSAAEAITMLVATNGLPASAGVRLGPSGAPERDLEIRLLDEPPAEDLVVDEGDAHVFIDPAIADELDEQTLEATTIDNRVRFALTPQPEP